MHFTGPINLYTACPVAPEDGTGAKFFVKDNEVYPVKSICLFCLTGATSPTHPINPINPIDPKNPHHLTI